MRILRSLVTLIVTAIETLAAENREGPYEYIYSQGTPTISFSTKGVAQLRSSYSVYSDRRAA